MDKAPRETGWETRCDWRKEVARIFDGMRKQGAIPMF